MNQNISLYIGNNAAGKTRVLKSIIKNAKEHNNAVVTNIEGYQKDYATDTQKQYLLLNSNNRITNNTIGKELDTAYKAQIARILSLICSRGDVLVLDELDANLTNQDIVDISNAISDVRHLWKEIYINGYSNYLLRLFTDIDRDTYEETYEPNVILVDENAIQHKLSEEDMYECFDTIRG